MRRPSTLPIAPPAELGWLTELLGDEGTLRLIEARGGTRLTLRADAQAPELVALLGEAAASALGERYAREQVKVPLAKAWRASLYRAQGRTYPEIARKLGVTETTVWRLLHASGDTRQMSMALR